MRTRAPNPRAKRLNMARSYSRLGFAARWQAIDSAADLSFGERQVSGYKRKGSPITHTGMAHPALVSNSRLCQYRPLRAATSVSDRGVPRIAYVSNITRRSSICDDRTFLFCSFLRE